MRVWLPYAEWAEDVPSGVDVDVYDGGGRPPSTIEDVELYVPPYMASSAEPFEVMRSMPALRVVQTLTAGVDNFLPYVPEGVTLCNARGVHDASTAELAVALILASLRGFPDFVRAQDRQEWASQQRTALADRTVLIVGYGAVGAAVEARLAGFECTVLRVARRSRDGVAEMSALPDLLPRADVVVLTVPMTEETVGLVDAPFLAAMRDGALLVNVARGPVVVTDALLAELREGAPACGARRDRSGTTAGRAPVVVGCRTAAEPARRRQHVGVPASCAAARGRAGPALRRRRATAQYHQRGLLIRPMLRCLSGCHGRSAGGRSRCRLAPLLVARRLRT